MPHFSKALFKIPSPHDRRPGKLNFVAGSLAGLTGQAITYPLDRSRAVMAVTPVGEYKNLWAVFGYDNN